VRVHVIVVLEPGIELGHDGGRIGSGIEPDVVALEGLHEGFGDAVGLGAADRREAWYEADRIGEGDRLVALKQLTLSASHSTGCGALRALKRRSTASSMRSRTAIPPMPRGPAVQARISRSWVSMANATRTASRPPSAIRRLQLNSRLGERPCLRVTNETDMPGCSVSSTSRIFPATDHHRRLHRGDHLDALQLVRHSRTPRLMPRPSCYADCPGETGPLHLPVLGYAFSAWAGRGHLAKNCGSGRLALPCRP